MTDTKPTYWAHAARWDAQHPDAATHFAAMAQAHLHAIDAVLMAEQTREQMAAAIAEHFQPYACAYTAAALLHGIEIDVIREQLEMGDTPWELLWEWLAAAGFTDEQIRALDHRPPILQSITHLNAAGETR